MSLMQQVHSFLQSTATKRHSVRRTARFYHLVIVESPAKCKTIESILNKGNENSSHDDEGAEKEKQAIYKVTSCYGHVRDLSKQKEVLPAEEANRRFPFSIAGIRLQDDSQRYTPLYEVIPAKQKVVNELQSLARKADSIYLATDPDREGEAMAWHLQTILSSTTRQKEKLPLSFHRMRFSEITKPAIQQALRLVEDEPANKDGTTANNNVTGIAMDLVNAQETRRVLDRLAGFTVSPVLWKFIAPGLSAGRVQSVGLRLIVERERERLLHTPQTYCTLQAQVSPSNNNNNTGLLTAQLLSINGQRIIKAAKDFNTTTTKKNGPLLHIDSLEMADSWVDRFYSPPTANVTTLSTPSSWTVTSVQHTPRTRQPPVPYKTSTLQQDAVRRFGWDVTTCMRVAQNLYEQGYISYMRTDSTVLSKSAQTIVQQTVAKVYGRDHVNDGQQQMKKNSKKAKHAQEAHEAIRPALPSNENADEGIFRAPADLPSAMTPAAKQLYTLIYQRTLAFRMPPLVTNQTTVTITGENSNNDTMEFTVSGSVVVKPGYTRVYNKQLDDDEPDILPPLHPGQPLTLHNLTSNLHQTQPPPRYTEASFVKELEALGVGRPSTYARVVNVLRERAYVTSKKSNIKQQRRGSAISAFRASGVGDSTTATKGVSASALVPSLSAFVVCRLLEQYCYTYVDPSFTADMEDRLDLIARGGDGDDQRVKYLDDFYAGPDGLAARVQRIGQEADANSARRVVLPPNLPETGPVGLYVGPWGPFIKKKQGAEEETTSLPLGMASDLEALDVPLMEALLKMKKSDSSVLGQHPKDGRNVRLKTGRFGAYLQWGDDKGENTTTHSLPKEKSMVRAPNLASAEEAIDIDDSDSIGELTHEAKQSLLLLNLTFEEAVGYVELPRTICTFNDLPIVAGIGPYGPYLKYNNTYASILPEHGDLLSIDTEAAQQLVTDEIINKPYRKPRGVLAELGEMEGYKVQVKSGRFGKYINWRKVNAKIPAEFLDNPEAIPLETAWELIQAKDDGSHGATKKKGDPDLPPKPKRPLSAYLHFCAAKRPEASRESKALGDVAKKLSALWKETSAKERVSYETLADQGKVQYQAELEKWKEENLTKSKSRSASSRGMTAPGPKRPLSSYLYFCAAKRPEVAAKIKKLGDVSKELARQWAETKDRSIYEHQALEDKERYQRELIIQQAGGESFPEATNGKMASSKRQPSLSVASKGTPKLKRPLSSYLFFCAAKRPEIAAKVKKLGDVSKELARLWKETEDRSVYEAQAKQDKERYGRELAGHDASNHSAIRGRAAPTHDGRTTFQDPFDKKKLDSTAAARGVLRPKRPLSSYLFFCSAQRPEVTKRIKKLGDISKELARLWAKTEDRSLYEQQAKLDKERYQRELEEIRTMGRRNNSEGKEEGPIVIIKRNNGQTNLNESSKPKKRGKSAYMLFCAEKRPLLVDSATGEKLSFGKAAQRLAAEWRACDEETRERFQRLAMEENEKMALLENV